jgi:hypothetical protein
MESLAGPVARVGRLLRREWRLSEPYQRLAYAGAAALLASAAVHTVVFAVAVLAVDGTSWHGPVSWRKPILFGLSFGVTLLSVGWTAEHLGVSRRVGWWLLGSATGASVLETALITLQRWRGVPSHFNFATGTDTAITAALAGVAIVGLVPPIVAFAVLALRRFDASPSMRLAARSGLLILVLAQATGGAMIANGRAKGVPPTTADLSIFGAAGQLKLPHAVTIHAMQVLPLFAVLLAGTAWSERRRVQLVAGAVAGYVGLVAVSLLQALDGLAPTDLTPWSGALLMVSGTLFCGVVVAAASRVRPARIYAALP